MLLRYHSRLLYTLLELGLEVVFQIEVIAYLPYFTTPWGPAFDRLGRGCAITMLLSHYLWFLSSCLRKAAPLLDPIFGSKLAQSFGSGLEDLEIAVEGAVEGALPLPSRPAICKRASTLTSWRQSVRASEVRAEHKKEERFSRTHQ